MGHSIQIPVFLQKWLRLKLHLCIHFWPWRVSLDSGCNKHPRWNQIYIKNRSLSLSSSPESPVCRSMFLAGSNQIKGILPKWSLQIIIHLLSLEVIIAQALAKLGAARERIRFFRWRWHYIKLTEADLWMLAQSWHLILMVTFCFSRLKVHGWMKR